MPYPTPALLRRALRCAAFLSITAVTLSFGKPIAIGSELANMTVRPIAPPLPQTCPSDTWTATSMTGAPTRRSNHVAIWTGNEMIIWAGVGSEFFNTGGKYDPATDSWSPTTTTDAPGGRQ